MTYAAAAAALVLRRADAAGEGELTEEQIVERVRRLTPEDELEVIAIQRAARTA